MTEDFNREEAKKIIKDISKRYYEANGKFIIKGNTEIVGASDSQLWGRSSVPYLMEAVEKALHSGMSASEIEDAVLNASDNIPFQPEGGDVAKKGDLAQNNIARHLARSIPSEGKSDKELNLEYAKFEKDFIPEDWDDFDNKLKKDGVPTAQRQRILTHLRSDWSGDDGIKQTVLDVAKSKLADGTSANSMELLAELAPYKGTGTPALKNLSMFLVMPEMSDEEMLDSMMNFSSASSAKQAELKDARPAAATAPPAATETAEGGGMGPSQAGAGGFDPVSPREVHFQGRDGNFYRATYDPTIKEYTSAPTLVGEDVAQRAIAREDAIYGRNRADQLRDAVTKRSQDLSDLSSLYDRQDSLYGRDIAREDALYGRDTAREDSIYGRNRADYLDDRVAEWAREDAIRQGNWTREDELMYRGRNWELQDIYDQRLYDEAQAAEDKTFRTAELGMQLAPTYMDSQLDAAKFEADILRNAGDYISAAFMQRGEPSPFTPVTQADMVNQYRKHVRDMMDATSAGFRSPYLEDTSWANIAPPRSAGEAPPPPPPAAPSAAPSAGAAAPAAGSAEPDDTKPATSSAGPAGNVLYNPDTDTGPLVESFVYGEDSPARRTISPEELAARRSLMGGNMPGGFRTPTEPVGAEFGAVNFQPPEQPIFAPPAVGSEFGDGAFVPPEGSLQPPSGGVIHIPSNPVRPPEGGVIHIPSSPTPGREFGDNQFIPPEQPVQPPQSQIFGMPANTGMSDIEQINMISEQLDAPQSVLPPTGGVMHIPSTQMQETFNYSDDAYVNPAQAAYDAQQAMAAQAAANIGTPVGGYVSGFNTPEQNPFYQHHPAMGYSGPEEESFSFTEDVFRPAPVDIQQSGFSPEGNNAIESRRPPQAPMFKLPEPKPTYYDFEF